jgi:hypothetical protein
MLRRVIQGVLMFFLAALAGTSSVRASRSTVASEKEKDEDCRKYVQQFYQWYADADFESWGVSQSLDDAIDQKVFSFDLADQLNDLVDAEEQHDAVWLDFDPVLNTRHPWDDYVAGAVTRKGEHFLVEVYGAQHGRRNARPDVVAELVFQIGRWTFVNFHYPNRDKSPATENLRSVLNGIRKSHPVKPHARRSDDPEAMKRQATINDPTIS